MRPLPLSHDVNPAVDGARASLSLAQRSMDPAPAAEVVRLAADAGFDAVGLRLSEASARMKPAVPSLSEAQVGECSRSLSDTGVYPLIATSLWIVPSMASSPDDALLDAAARLGFEYYMVLCDEPDEAHALDVFSRLYEKAAIRGMKIALEFAPYTAIASIHAASSFLTKAAQTNAGMVVDALHLARSGGGPEDISAVAPELLCVAQICDAPKEAPPTNNHRLEARTRRLIPGEGELWLEQLLRALPPGIRVEVEAPNESDRASPSDRASRLFAASVGLLNRAGRAVR